MIHTLNDYQAKALSFRMESANEQYAVENLAGEVGELFSLRAKAIRDGRKFDYEQNVKKELGDILWSVAAIAADNGFTLADVANGNIFKLESRSARNVLGGSGDNR
jgi:NTP pyrophosphatase (non-canonical NTP hydrolase)